MLSPNETRSELSLAGTIFTVPVILPSVVGQAPRPPLRLRILTRPPHYQSMRRRRLPHLDVIGEPQFLTFRLRDSLPPNRLFPASSLTFLKQPEVAQAVVASILYGVEIGHYQLHSWVIMPNHVHLLLTPQVSLSRLLGSMKGATAKRANLLLHRTGECFWQDESYDHFVRNGEEFRRIQRYIESNPVKACLVA